MDGWWGREKRRGKVGFRNCLVCMKESVYLMHIIESSICPFFSLSSDPHFPHFHPHFELLFHMIDQLTNIHPVL